MLTNYEKKQKKILTLEIIDDIISKSPQDIAEMTNEKQDLENWIAQMKKTKNVILLKMSI